ncbi:uncharacterized protein LOC110822625 isoform X1 [Carica papaya]|uniref:uncharacterized protein LOC110822625 isoform X1 n=1 Tax=Carica papaya TaxID=3649 RepID=UPI000B8CDDC4|nr:uncharacterized protein LOC110822625 isoform X1 [Carica papaya]
MNFLLRPTQHIVVEPTPVPETPAEIPYVTKPSATLEGLIAEDPFPQYSRVDDSDGVPGENGGTGPSAKSDTSMMESHSDVSEEEGWITIPYRKLPDNWNDAQDINSLRPLDRSFVFPGEQLHILACLSACKRETEIITPFKVAAVMSRNGMRNFPEKENGNVEGGTDRVSIEGEVSPDDQVIDKSVENLAKKKIDPQKDVTASESLLRMEDHKRQTERLLKKFKNSHFFVRIAESDEQLWSKKSASKTAPDSGELDDQKSKSNESKNSSKDRSRLNAVIDRGNFDANISGGVARNTVKCYALCNGDIAVLIQVNVSVDSLKDPVIEILQFEKYRDRNLSSGDQNNFKHASQDPCGELLKWLLPLDNTLPPPTRSLSPPPVSSTSGIGTTSQRSAFSASSGSQLFSFGHFRSYSMSSLPPNTPQPSGPVKAQSSKPSFDLEEWDHHSSYKLLKGQRTGNEELLSFRSVSLERERFSVRCGLEGIYIPGRRWRRKIEIIQPVEIHSFAADCNTADFLCVQIKNVSPAHTPDIVIYIDAITLVFEEAAKGGPPSSLPIACVEAGNDHSLPNLALRRGEEHSFILKPASSMKNFKALSEKTPQSSSLRLASTTTVDRKETASTGDLYAIMVSCRCNYTESRLFFKQRTSWRPRISRDLMISVASEMSGKSSGPHGRVTQLPVQVLTLQASNLTSEDLTLTVLAPASFTSPPSVVSLNSSPSSPMSPFVGFSEFTERVSSERRGSAIQRLSSAPVASEKNKEKGDGGARSISFNEQSSSVSDVIPTSGLGCTHLWLQSRVPLGCVPSQSTATIKLELLPLTDGIITLDTLQIDVKEKGLTYIPEHSLKINATSSISTGII